MDKLINEKKYIINKFIDKIKECYTACTMDYIMKYLLKYGYVSNDFHNLFGEFEYNIFYDIKEYFYYNKKNYYFNENFDYNNYREIVDKFIIKNYNGYDISLLEYCLEISNKNNILIPQDFKSEFKMASYLPLNMLKKYIIIFEPNKLKFIILDDIK